MKNGNGKVSSKDLMMSKFLHKGKWHFSYDGKFVECDTFYQMQEMNISDSKIFKEFGKSYEESELKYNVSREKVKYPKIHNWQQLLDFMFSIMKEDRVKFIKSKITEDMNAKSLIPLLPEPFQPIFLLRLDYDDKIKEKISGDTK